MSPKKEQFCLYSQSSLLLLLCPMMTCHSGVDVLRSVPLYTPATPEKSSKLSTEEAEAFAACTLLDVHTAVRASALLESSDTLLQRATRSLAQSPLLPQHLNLLPRAQGSEYWSVAEYLLDLQAAVPTSLSSLGRRINNLTVHFAVNRSDEKTVSEAVAHRELAAEWWDTEGFVERLHDIYETSAVKAEYTRRVSIFDISKPFPLQVWGDYHRQMCRQCDTFYSQAGSFRHAMEQNHANPCYFSDILCWLSGGWRLPLVDIPPPRRCPNHSSLLWSPSSIAPEARRMRERGVLVPGTPHIVNPAMAVVRDGDLADALRILRGMGRRCPFSSKHDIDKINDHIRAVLVSLPPDDPAHTLLKPIKIRFCIDSSKTLNPHLAHWPFSYASVSDAIALLKRGWWMARIDLEKFFNQILLHISDWKYLGVNLDELAKLIGELDHWRAQGIDVSEAIDLVSAYAQFGVASFPALANALMAATAAILRHAGIPNCFLTDDVFVCGATEEACQQHLDKALSIIASLGWRYQPTKIIPPSQCMVFLGILIDTVKCRLSIPANKLEQYAASVQAVIDAEADNKLRYKDLESLVGKLNWVSEVTIAGRARVRRLSACLWMRKSSRRTYALAHLSTGAKADLQWWRDYLARPDVASRWVPFWTTNVPLHCSTFSDAAGDVGYSLVMDGTVYQGLWSDDAALKSSGYKELIPLLLAVQQLGPEAEGRVVIMTTDNLGNVFAINKGSCKSDASYELLCRIFEIAAQKKIYLVADWVPREHNIFQDAVSRYPWHVHV